MKKYIFFLPLIILGFTACEDVVQVDLNEQDNGLYAVEAKITTISEPTVFLARALPVTVDSAYNGVSGAVVTITDDAQPSNMIKLVEDQDSAGYYIVPAGEKYFGKVGQNYTLTIETGNVTLTATEYLERVEKIDSIQIHPSNFGDGIFLGVFSYGLETPGKGNYYKWDIYVNDTLLNDASTLSTYSDDLVDGKYVSGAELYTDFYDPNKPEDRKLKYMDTVYVNQNSISKSVYEFYLAMINQSYGGSLFSVPPANAKGNFISSDGKTVLGMFTAQDVSQSNKVVINDSIEGMLKK